MPLTPVRQKGGKLVMAWAFEGEGDPERITCNTFTMEWPPRSGKMQRYPEVDRAAFFTPEEARKKLNPAQAAFVDELVAARWRRWRPREARTRDTSKDAS